MPTRIPIESDSSRPVEVNRRLFLRRGGLLAGAGALAVHASWPAIADAQGLGDGQTRQNFRDIMRHETDHVDFLVTFLGADARPMPTFQNLLQRNRKEFFEVSQALENTGVGAYLGAAPAIDDRGILAAAGSIALIEARHAGWLNTLLNDPLTENVFGAEQSFERALNLTEVLNLAGGFIANLNGGPPVTYSTTPSPANDIDILNFALALEYLEAEFYNVNVPRFIK